MKYVQRATGHKLLTSAAELTCVVQRRGDARCGPLAAKLRHATVTLHSERVVQVRLQFGDDDGGFRQVRGPRLEAHLLVTIFAGHAVGEVAALTGHQRGAPGELQSALGWQRGRAQFAGGTGRSLRRKRLTEEVSLIHKGMYKKCGR